MPSPRVSLGVPGGAPPSDAASSTYGGILAQGYLMSHSHASRSSTRWCLAAIASFVVLAGPVAVQGQQAPGSDNLSAEALAKAEQSRPRLGLALGGGSARGLAHIGLLQWLEEHRIPIDAIAGTSMGGLVGGAYATGLSPQEIRTLLDGTDWKLIFQGESPFS